MSKGWHPGGILRVFLAAVCSLAVIAAFWLSPASSASASGSRMSTFLDVGPQATPANVAGPNYGLFTCQVGLAPFVCYDPYQMRAAYHLSSLVNAGYTGAGRTIVIVDAFQSPYLPADLTYFDTFYSLPPASLTQVAPDGLTPFNPADPNMVGWSQEITLDVEWAHAIAPSAHIVLDLAKSNNDPDILSAIKYAVDNRLGDVISQSFGENENCVDPNILAAQNQVYADATSKNITIFASSGDEGAAQQTCDGNSWTRAVSFPADDPLVTAVGGTELHAAGYCLAVLGCDPTQNPAPGTYQGEIAWNEFDSAASGGGYSTVFDEPSYQNGTIHGGKQRAVPDVAYNAAIYHGVLVRYGSAWWLFGGTSCGSPQWAALAAIADQKAGHDLGFLNRALYHMGQAGPHDAAAFSDVTSGNNSVVELDVNGNPVSVSGYSAGAGWDPTTGLGSPIGDSLVDELIQFVSPGDGAAAVAQATPHGSPAAHGKGRQKPH